MAHICDKCGACCRTFPVFVSDKDALVEPRIRACSIEVPDWQKSEERAYMLHPLPFLCACTFLSSDNLCRIYDSRPQVCRSFEPGSPECDEARKRMGYSPLDSEASMSIIASN